MTRDECHASVLAELPQALHVSAGIEVSAPWAPAAITELQDLYYPDPLYVFSESDVANLVEQMRIRWEEGKLG